MDELRIDKWLWASRLFKTRRLAAEACQAGKVKLNGRSVKPGRAIRVGDGLQITRKRYRQQICVTGLSERRVSPPVAATLYEDTTPNEELEQARLVNTMESTFRRERRGAGRPTKRDRRALQKLKGQL
ncbi:MAG: hypothetical protein GH143_03080 [Calditrichaeota bacterium]|nr:hypothetical protein [Calditrichota bacterium]